MDNVNTVSLMSNNATDLFLQLQNNTNNNDYELVQLDTSVFDLELPMDTNTDMVNETGTINDVPAGTCDIPM